MRLRIRSLKNVVPTGKMLSFNVQVLQLFKLVVVQYLHISEVRILIFDRSEYRYTLFRPLVSAFCKEKMSGEMSK